MLDGTSFPDAWYFEGVMLRICNECCGAAWMTVAEQQTCSSRIRDAGASKRDGNPIEKRTGQDTTSVHQNE